MPVSRGEFKFDITAHVGTLSSNAKTAWSRELNLVSWNGAPAKYDLRDWSPDHSKMGKGISLTPEEIAALRQLLADIKLPLDKKSTV